MTNLSILTAIAVMAYFVEKLVSSRVRSVGEKRVNTSLESENERTIEIGFSESKPTFDIMEGKF